MRGMAESVIAIIPARGGSKRLPRKNILPLGGKPLIAWTIEAAKTCSLINRVIVSTDDDEIAGIARLYGADVPFIRPLYLAEDTSSSEDVFLHAINWLEEHEAVEYDIVVPLQVTDVFRRNTIVHKVVQKLLDSPHLDTVFAAYPEHKNYWKKEKDGYVPLDNRGHVARQLKEHIFREDTGIACATRTHVIRQKKRIGKNVEIIPHISGFDFIDIHDERDLWFANKIIEERNEFPNESSSRS